ncbi:MAG: 2-oxoglutarate dehydrogenase E1 component [Acidobacteria bacterium]|nr:2-oxoglutarate dehydrogenase E1 component [Acidobacteriota bacterium]
MSQPAQLHSLSLDYVEALLAQYRRDPASLDDEWRRYFDSLAAAGELDAGAMEPSIEPPPLFGNGASMPAAAPTPVRPAAPAPAPPEPAPVADSSRTAAPPLTADIELQRRVDDLIRNYRIRGHLFADINPLRNPPALPEELELEGLGIKESDLDRTVSTAGIPGADTATVREVWERMRDTYCQYISAEFMHIDDLEVRSWLQERMEISRNRVHLSRREQVRILKKLIDATVFEEFIQKKYLGAKSFSLEGAESLIPLLDLAIEKVAAQGAVEIVFGMSHRGRLNVLANIIGKPTRDIFREFEDLDAEHYTGGGDVKYHMGHSSDWTTDQGRRVHLSLSFNPSHLEFINPVAMGRVRAKQDRIRNELRDRGVLFLIHGDAAFAGEGIVQESLNLSQLPAYHIGGALHVVVNNQIGFTTPPESSRSNTYCTDVAKMLQAPIFHVNGEYPEAVAQVVNVALDFRQRYRRDVIIDLYCYRRRGHNEGDEPAFTQPILYDGIRARDPVRVHYLEHLLELGEIKPEEADIHIQREEKRLEGALATARRMNEKTSPQAYDGVWNAFVGGRAEDIPEPPTGVPEAKLRGYLKRMVELPEDFNLHRNLRRFLAARAEMAEGKRPVDWAAAEALAFAATADSGQRVRMSGQDCERGTFSQRHSVLHDRVTDENFRPLMNVAENQEPIEIFNSPLSEAGVLGFEYGFSLDYPDGLVIWEAQFGDFVNAAQVIIDQFITSAEDKWNRLSGLVILLPHGFEGQGPEHSSARIERWLLLAAEENVHIVYPSTPAQYFHLLRRQVERALRKPLIVFTPKSLLRRKEVGSELAELARGSYQPVLPDPALATDEDRARIRRILICSGKVFYDLDAHRRQTGTKDHAILRMEQFYPAPKRALDEVLAPFPADAEVRWVQEEPRNMGAWSYLRLNFGFLMGGRPLSGIYRPQSASPATGSPSSHKLEQQELIESAFADSVESA